MLPTINLTSADLTSLTDSAAGTQGLTGASTEPEGSFADLLRGPVMVAAGEPYGDALPATGNELPLLDAQALLGRLASGQQWPAQGSLGAGSLEEGSLDEGLPNAGVLENTPLASLVSVASDAVDEIAVRTVTPAPGMNVNSEQIRRPSLAPGLASMLPGAETDRGATPDMAQRATNHAAGRAAISGLERPAGNLNLPVSGDQRTTPLPTGSAEYVPAGVSEPSVSPTINSSSTAAASANAGLPFAAQAPIATLQQTAGTPVLESSIPLPIQDSAWSDSLGERVVFMSGNRIQNAEIRLTPAELGPIRVNVSLDDGAAHVTFSAQHATTREAIEAAMPRLREMLAEQGLSLGNANVADQGPNPESERPSAAEDQESAAVAASADTESSLTVEEQAVRRRVARGLVDTFV